LHRRPIILDARFSLRGEMGDAQNIELRRVLKSWSDPANGGDWNSNPTGGPTWTYSSYPTAQWNPGRRRQTRRQWRRASDYNSTNDLAARVDGTFVMQAVNEEVTFSGANITQAFRFWFDNPALDYGYALRVANNATQEVKFERWEAGLKEHGRCSR